MAIGRHGAFLLAPAGEGWHAPLRLELHAVEAGRDQAEFLFRFIWPGRMDRERPWIGEPCDLEDPFRQNRPEILPGPCQNLLEIGTGYRTDRFETAQMGEAIVRGQQAVQPGRARAHRPHDHYRLADRARQNFRMPLEPHLRIEPVAQQVVDGLHPRQLARSIQPSFDPRGIEQHVERAGEPVIAEIVEPVFLAHLLQQRLAVPAGRIDQPQLAPRPDPRVENVDKAGAPRRYEWLVLQVSVTFLFCFAAHGPAMMRVRATMICQRIGAAAFPHWK